MKKIIAGAALVGTLLTTGSAALAENHAAATTQAGAETTAQTTTQTGSETTAQTATQTGAETTAQTTTQTGSETTAQTATQAGAETTAQTTTQTAAETTAQTGVQTGTEEALPKVSLTPDKLFYALKLWIEKIQLAITTDAAERAALLEQQAQLRLAEAKAMAEAGKADLAEQAMLEAKAKLADAQKQIEAAARANKDMSKLVARVEADQTRFAVALNSMLAKAPDSVKVEIEPAVTDLLVQLAETKDATAQDEQAAKEAEQVAAEAELKVDLSPRRILVLKAMAEASGKSLSEVTEMYRVNPGLGRIAKELGLKMGPIQHAAKIEWKSARKAEVKVEAEKEREDTGEVKAEVKAEAKDAQTERKTREQKAEVKVRDGGLKIELMGKGHDHDDDHDDDLDDDRDDDHTHGHGKGKGKGKH